ncbi:MAG: 4'-phosphopantetheinyl transferase superfamily protein [Leptolyngbya sp. SIO1E4]|nr:4'-phosphopantetheinyl transferase superfamily protein [Leptolyngbya sp. SIO1E4]
MLSPLTVAKLLPALPLPSKAETHIWQLPLAWVSTQADNWSLWLSRDEQDRAQRFYRSQDRTRFILCRGGLRYLLARYLGCPPDALAFAYGPHGKPSLVNPPRALHFNLAHTKEWVVYGVGHHEHLGVDVEQIVPRLHLDGLIQRCLMPEEQACLSAAPAERLNDFFRYWTVKEAHLKAIGLGLSYPMTDVQVAWQPAPYLVRPAQTKAGSPHAWTVKLWHPTETAIAAACVGQADSRLSIRFFPLDS